MTDSPAPYRLGSSYLLEAPVGAGAQGEVWHGRRVDSEEPLAFKILRSDLVDNPDVVERFIKERSTLLRVRSPYVVAIRDVVIEGATFAIVMDYVDGGDLRDLLRAEGSLQPANLAAIGSCIAQGLAAVHEAGVVHRDVKPANILLASAGGWAGQEAGGVQTLVSSGFEMGGQRRLLIPKVADFGVARICDTLTSAQATGVIGTPLYMAPEILSVQAPTPAADIYSLGIMLYEMACGTTPFTGDAARLLAQHARRDPGRPQGVPDALWEVVAAMLAKHPSARPPLEAVIHRLDALQTELAGLPAAPVLAAPPESAISQAPYDWDQPAPGGAPAPAGPASAPSSPVGTAPGTPSGPWAATVAGTTAPTLSAQLSGLPAATPPTAIGDGAMPGGPLPPPTQGPLAISSGMAPGSPAPAAAAAPGGRRRRRRLWIPALAVVLVIALAAGGFLLWRHYRDQGSVQAGWLISLPEASRAREDMRVSKISELRISPDGSMLAGESGSTWSLYDLSAAATDSVWSGECSEAAFWSSEALLCTQSGDKRVLVSRDGSTSAVPGPSESTLIGAAEERTILVDADVFDGDLIALDAEGKEAWRAYGKYSEGIVRNGFVLTYESESHAIQVLSAQTGAVLTSVRDEEPDFSDDGAGSPPGGFDLTLSTQAFARLTKDGATIYDAEGTTTQTITGDFSGTVNVATSTPLSPEALAEAYRASSARPSSHYAVGPNGVEEVAVDIHACTATAKGKALEIPKRSEGQTCLIKPLGIIGGDILVAQVGEPSDAQTESVLGLSLDDGSVVWKAAGTYRGVAPTEEGGRLIVSHGANPSDIAVVSLSEK